MASEIFNHTALNHQAKEIRLLKVQRSHDSSQPIQCILQHFDLAKRPQYKALSYTWGEPLPTRDIIINGSPLPIRDNLYQFLASSASAVDTGESPWLWIDQLCIRQDNIQERNHQVRQMPEIYSSAAEVLVWLSPAFPGSDDIMSDIRTFEPPDAHVEPSREERGSHWEQLEAAILPALERFVTLPYWSRLWISQELLLARRVRLLLGDSDGGVTWEQFSAWHSAYQLAITICGDSLRLPRGLWRLELLTLYRDGREEVLAGGGFSWSDAMRVAEGSLCHDPRDMAFGLMGVVAPHCYFAPDYAMSAREVLECVLRMEIAADVTNGLVDESYVRVKRYATFLCGWLELLHLADETDDRDLLRILTRALLRERREQRGTPLGLVRHTWSKIKLKHWIRQWLKSLDSEESYADRVIGNSTIGNKDNRRASLISRSTSSSS